MGCLGGLGGCHPAFQKDWSCGCHPPVPEKVLDECSMAVPKVSRKNLVIKRSTRGSCHYKVHTCKSAFDHKWKHQNKQGNCVTSKEMALDLQRVQRCLAQQQRFSGIGMSGRWHLTCGKCSNLWHGTSHSIAFDQAGVTLNL
eukprot:1159472-Pelagomonas_calceolata.AAC.2